jgi:hypothetical protein
MIETTITVFLALIAAVVYFGIIRKTKSWDAEQAERWEDDALRLMQERNVALKERDDARRTVLLWLEEHCTADELADEIKQRGWEYLKESK